MRKIKEVFQSGKSFIAFLTCGDPDLDTTEKLIKEIALAGADLIELGIPFSDPTAEGPTIQAANVRALSGGVTTDKIFDMVKRVSSEISVPLVFMTYANVVFSYDTDRFLKKAADCGISGLILPDVPFEEKEDFTPFCRKYEIEFISLIAPTSNNRIEMIAKEAEGFIYCVSSLGVTGMRNSITADLGEITALIRRVTNLPCAIGFGISTPEQAAELSHHGDGIIVGSAL